MTTMMMVRNAIGELVPVIPDQEHSTVQVRGQIYDVREVCRETMVVEYSIHYHGGVYTIGHAFKFETDSCYDPVVAIDDPETGSLRVSGHDVLTVVGRLIAMMFD